MDNFKLFKDSARAEYYVSSRGLVKSVNKKTGKERLLSAVIKKSDKYDKQGYLVFSIKSGPKNVQYHIHRVVCELFNGEPPAALFEVNHKDGNKHNNSMGNLEWVTRSENMLHAHRNNLISCADVTGDKNPNFKYSDSMALAAMTLEKKYTREYLAQSFGVHKSVVDSGLALLRRMLA